MNLTPDTKKFTGSLGGKPLYELSPEEARDFLENLQKSYEFVGHRVNIEDFNLETGLEVRVVRPKNAMGKLPAILYIHGGGWVLGSKNSWANLLEQLSECTGAAVIFPEYSLSPEAKFPTALNEIFSVLQNSDRFNIDNKKLVIAGDSVGGNMATATALRAAKEGRPFIFELLFYPVTDASMKTNSYGEFEEGPWLSKKAMEWFFDAYEPDKEKRKDVRISPILTEQADLSLLPETLIITAENDVLRDEGEQYAKKLGDAGIKAACVRINGTCHDFMVLNALAETEPRKTAFLLACAKIKEVFAR